MPDLLALMPFDVDPAPLAAWGGLVIVVFGIITGVVAGIAALWKWLAHPRIAAQISEATSGLQPRNGGQGWSDLHGKLDVVIERQGHIAERVDDVVANQRDLRNAFTDHLADHDK